MLWPGFDINPGSKHTWSEQSASTTAICSSFTSIKLLPHLVFTSIVSSPLCPVSATFLYSFNFCSFSLWRSSFTRIACIFENNFNSNSWTFYLDDTFIFFGRTFLKNKYKRSFWSLFTSLPYSLRNNVISSNPFSCLKMC